MIKNDYFKYSIGFIFILASLYIRYLSYPIISADYTSSLSHWMDALRGGQGLSAFETPFSNYPPLYLYILKLLSLIPVYDLYAIKTVSILFDIGLAIIVVLIIKHLSGRKINEASELLYFSLILIIPTVFLNSSLWAQCDSIYTFFVLLSFYLVLKNRPLAALLFFAIAFSLKLQSIFFLPVLVGYFIGRKKSLWNFILIPVIYFITIIPAWLSGGRLIDLLSVYVSQTMEFEALTLSAPSIYAFFAGIDMSESTITIFAHAGEVVALIVSILIIYAVSRTVKLEGEYVWTRLHFLSLFSVIALPFFLPHMHERYFYMADIMSIVYAILYPKRIYVPILVIGSSFLSYMYFLSPQVKLFAEWLVPIWVPAILMSLALVMLIPRFITIINNKNQNI